MLVLDPPHAIRPCMGLSRPSNRHNTLKLFTSNSFPTARVTRA
jgi:hypothetical protein